MEIFQAFKRPEELHGHLPCSHESWQEVAERENRANGSTGRFEIYIVLGTRSIIIIWWPTPNCSSGKLRGCPHAIIYTVVGLTAAVFPYLKKDLFETAPTIVKRKIDDVPLVTILGVLVFISNIFVTYATLTPAFTGGPLNPVYVSIVALISIVAIILYYISYAYHRSKGFDLALIYKEIPPE